MTVRGKAGLIQYKLPQAVGGSGVAAVDVIVVEITDADGAGGLGFSYVLGGNGGVVFKAAQEQVARFVDGQVLPPPPALWRKIAASFNRTGYGPNLIALGAIDVAAWDLAARRLKLPLGVAMGGELRAVPVYGSGGFNTVQPPQKAAIAAAHFLDARRYAARGGQRRRMTREPHLVLGVVRGRDDGVTHEADVHAHRAGVVREHA